MRLFAGTWILEKNLSCPVHKGNQPLIVAKPDAALLVRAQSLSLGSFAAAQRRRPPPQPVAELAYNPEDIKARLSGVPVYTVANKKNEFVLVSGEVRGCN